MYRGITSSNAKKVEKRTLDGNYIDSYTTIAKAAQSEGIPATKMSRIIKRKTEYNGHIFVSL